MLSAPHLEMDRFRERVLPHGDQRVEDRDVALQGHAFRGRTAGAMVQVRISSLDATYTACEWCRPLARRRRGSDLAGRWVVLSARVSVALAVERWARRAAHPALDLTAERVAMLARDYPYFPATCRVDVESQSSTSSRSRSGQPASH